VKKKKKSHK